MTVGDRYRLHVAQGGQTHVSSVILSREEADEALQLEADLHRAAGWEVIAFPIDDSGMAGLLCVSRRGRMRRLWVGCYKPGDDPGPSDGASQPTGRTT